VARRAARLLSVRKKVITKREARRLLSAGKNPKVLTSKGRSATLTAELRRTDYRIGGDQLFGSSVRKRIEHIREAAGEKDAANFTRFAVDHPRQAERLASIIEHGRGQIGLSRWFEDIDMTELLDYEPSAAWFGS
jgi:hypothetical protein